MNRLVGSAAALAALGAVMATSVQDANATLALRLATAGASTVTIVDGPDGALDGSVSFSGALGAFVMNLSGGLSTPILSQPAPHLDLGTMNASGGPATITISLSETGLSSSSALNWFNTFWAVSTRGSSTLQVYVNLDNSLFNASLTGTQVANLSTGTPGAFLSATGLAATDASYSVTLVWTIVHTAAGQSTSGNVDFQVPEPASLALFGIGLLGLGFLGRRRAKQDLAA